MKSLLSKLNLATVLVAVAIVAGCETGPVVSDVEQPVADQSVVFGHVDVTVDGKIQEWGYGWTGMTSCCLMILPPDSDQAITYRIDEDGIFYWNLAPGDYQLLGFRYQKGNASQVGVVGGEFTVPEDSEAVYIGNIKIDMMKGRYVTVVEDKTDELVAAYKAEFPGRPGDVTIALLKLPDKIGNFSGVVHECSDVWGVDCSGKYRGITPLTPAVETNQFIKTDTLLPVFSWEPADREGASYDLIVYEVAKYSTPGGLSNQMMKGRMVVYEEDIADPSYRLKSPLKEDTKYYWSVRLRDGDVVSRWSTYSHFGFYVFYTTSGYGQWFGFSTP
jgi:hypothetical protein